MNNEKNLLYSLIPLEDFKAVLSIDDREDKLARFCLVTSTLTIEQYCKRKFLRKKYFECIEFYGDLFVPLREYPVSNVLALFALFPFRKSEIIEPDLYKIVPDCGLDIDIPFYLSLSPSVKGFRGCKALKVVYWAGYPKGKVPAELASACLELAAWNMNRYRGRRIGLTGNIRGAGKEGEHFEMSMPENVRSLLEPYQRKLI